MKLNFKRTLALITLFALIIAGVSCISVFAQESESFPPGDINFDKHVNITDATLLQKIVTKIVDTPADIDTYGDMNCDGEVNIKDVTVIQKYLVEIYKELPINKDNLSTNQTTSSTKITSSTTTTITTATTATTPITSTTTPKYDPTATDPEGWHNQIIKP